MIFLLNKIKNQKPEFVLFYIFRGYSNWDSNLNFFLTFFLESPNKFVET